MLRYMLDRKKLQVDVLSKRHLESKSLRQFAEQCMCSKSTIDDIENGFVSGGISVNILMGITNYMDVPITDYFKEFKS